MEMARLNARDDLRIISEILEIALEFALGLRSVDNAGAIQVHRCRSGSGWNLKVA
jgi:hypothetical protein